MSNITHYLIFALLLSFSLSLPMHTHATSQETTSSIDKGETYNSNNLSSKSLLYVSQQIALMREKQHRQLKEADDYTQSNDGEEEDGEEVKVIRKIKRTKRHASRFSSPNKIGEGKKSVSRDMDVSSTIPSIDVEVMNVRAHEATVVVTVDIPSWVWCRIDTAEEFARGKEFTTSLRRYSVTSVLSFQYHWLESQSSFAVTCKARNQKNAALERLSDTRHFSTFQETSCMLNEYVIRFEKVFMDYMGLNDARSFVFHNTTIYDENSFYFVYDYYLNDSDLTLVSLSRLPTSLSFTFSQPLPNPVICSLYARGSEEGIQDYAIKTHQWNERVSFAGLQADTDYEVVCMEEEMVVHQLSSNRIFQHYLLEANAANTNWLHFFVTIITSLGRGVIMVVIVGGLGVLLYLNRTAILSSIKGIIGRSLNGNASEDSDPEKHALLKKPETSAGSTSPSVLVTEATGLSSYSGIGPLSKEAEAVLENLERHTMTKWRCVVCQYLNDAREGKCVMCQAARVDGVSTGRGEGGEEAEEIGYGKKNEEKRRSRRKGGRRGEGREGERKEAQNVQRVNSGMDYVNQQGRFELDNTSLYENSGNGNDKVGLDVGEEEDDGFTKGFDDGFGEVAMDVVVAEKEVRHAPPQIVRVGGNAQSPFDDDDDDDDDFEMNNEMNNNWNTISKVDNSIHHNTIQSQSPLSTSFETVVRIPPAEEKKKDIATSLTSFTSTSTSTPTPMSLSKPVHADNSQQSTIPSSTQPKPTKSAKSTTKSTTKPTTPSSTQTSNTEGMSTPVNFASHQVKEAKDAGVTIRQKAVAKTTKPAMTKAAPVKIVTAGKGMKLSNGPQPRKSGTLKKPEVMNHDDLFAELGINAQVKKTTRISKQTAVVPSVDVSSDSVSDGGWGKDEDDLDL